MKFSSISLIAAGLVAIAGSAIAAPGPLAVDNLFKRQPADHQRDHTEVALAYYKSAIKHLDARDKAHLTSHGPTHKMPPKFWKEAAEKHHRFAEEDYAFGQHHLLLSLSPKNEEEHKHIAEAKKRAASSERTADMGIQLAVADRGRH